MYDASRHSPLSVTTMRTTLSIDDDVLAAAKHRAEREHMTVGQALSELVRAGLARDTNVPTKERNGILLLPIRKDTKHASLEVVKQLRDESL
jgi:Arc/MetJ family transcription regulator